jgi:hypothetical protein
MVEIRTPDYLRDGHHFDPGPFALDLYRLLCMVLADPRVSDFKTEDPILAIRNEYLGSEVIRILISTSVALRIWFDQTDERLFVGLKTDCGTLWPEWPKPKAKKGEVLTLREACNKIIHATKVHYDLVLEMPGSASHPDPEERYILPFLFLYGEKGKQNWRAKLSIVDFVKWGVAAFQRGPWQI